MNMGLASPYFSLINPLKQHPLNLISSVFEIHGFHPRDAFQGRIRFMVGVDGRMLIIEIAGRDF
ncbi:MAG: hypothetical protein ACTHLW_20885 [Verrucomicrobiota bacterium]